MLSDIPRDVRAEELTGAAREGLPRGFRMRHDAHFVDQLDTVPAPAVLRMLPLAGIDAPVCDDGPQIEALASSLRRAGMIEPLVVRRRGSRYQLVAGAKRFSAARLAEIDPVPCVVRDDVSDDAVQSWRVPPAPASRLDERPRGPFSSSARERALDQGIASMNAARQAIELGVPRSTELRSRTALDVLRAELLSTRHSLTAMRMLSSMPLMRRAPVHPADLVESAVGELAPITRLTGARIEVSVHPELRPVPVMRPVAAFALEGCLAAVLNLAGDTGAPVILLDVRQRDMEAEMVEFTVRLEGGWLPQEAAMRLTDADWEQHPGGVATAMVCAGAEAAAKAHGGGLHVITGGDDFSVVLTFRRS